MAESCIGGHHAYQPVGTAIVESRKQQSDAYCPNKQHAYHLIHLCVSRPTALLLGAQLAGQRLACIRKAIDEIREEHEEFHEDIAHRQLLISIQRSNIRIAYIHHHESERALKKADIEGKKRAVGEVVFEFAPCRLREQLAVLCREDEPSRKQAGILSNQRTQCHAFDGVVGKIKHGK